MLIPDVCPGELLGLQLQPLPEGKAGGSKHNGNSDEAATTPQEQHIPDFSMVAGDFQQVYATQVGCWDCLVTCFFLDTAPVVIEYIELIHQLLRPGTYVLCGQDQSY